MFDPSQLGEPTTDYHKTCNILFGHDPACKISVGYIDVGCLAK